MRINLKALPLGGFGWAAFATLVNEEKEPGTYEVEFTSNSGSVSSFRFVRNLTSGIYFYLLRAGSNIETREMVSLK